MSTWNTVTVRAVVALDTLPDIEEFSLIHEDGWDHVGGRLIVGGEGLRSPHTATAFSGESKYRRDEIGEWCVEWTAANPGIAVEWSQTWDDDGQGESLDVYRDGELVRGESKIARLTPIDMHAMIAAVRAELPKPDHFDPCMALTRTVRELLDALDPEVAR